MNVDNNKGEAWSDHESKQIRVALAYFRIEHQTTENKL